MTEFFKSLLNAFTKNNNEDTESGKVDKKDAANATRYLVLVAISGALMALVNQIGDLGLSPEWQTVATGVLTFVLDLVNKFLKNSKDDNNEVEVNE